MCGESNEEQQQQSAAVRDSTSKQASKQATGSARRSKCSSGWVMGLSRARRLVSPPKTQHGGGEETKEEKERARLTMLKRRGSRAGGMGQKESNRNSFTPKERMGLVEGRPKQITKHENKKIIEGEKIKLTIVPLYFFFPRCRQYSAVVRLGSEGEGKQIGLASAFGTVQWRGTLNVAAPCKSGDWTQVSKWEWIFGQNQDIRSWLEGLVSCNPVNC